jgi:hypothetical protein
VILARNFAELTVSAPDQTIFVNDSRVGTGSYSAHLVPGKYTVRSERGEAYAPDQKEFFLALDDSKSISLEAKPRLGTVSVVVEPFEARGADIYLNGELKGKAPAAFPLIIGTHSISARFANYLDVSQSVNVKDGEQLKVTLTMGTYAGSRQSSIDAWSRSKWISAAFTVIAGAASYYLQNQSDTYYQSYQLAATPDAAVSSRDKTNQFATYSTVALGAAGAGAIGAIVSWIWQASY